MKQYIFFFLFIISICSSCRKVYNPDINAPQDALVVEGLITDDTASCYVRLTLASPYDSSNTGYRYVKAAKVSVFDNFGNNYPFSESKYGMYYPNNKQMVGIPGRSYTLHIETQDGNIFESSLQLMLPNVFNDSVYAENTTKVTLDQNNQQVFTAGVELLTDITSTGESLPRFRYKVEVTSEHYWSVPVSSKAGPPRTFSSYCWGTTNPNDLVNLTDEKYNISSNEILGHALCFLDSKNFSWESVPRIIHRDTLYVESDTMYVMGQFFIIPADTIIKVDTVIKKDTVLYAFVINRLIKVSRYRINDEAYQYYKNINLLLSAQGKMFDPIANQFNGNIKCVNNPQKIVLGLFEASSVNVRFFSNKPGQTKVNAIQRFTLSSPSDCMQTFGGPPNFWIY
jgi:hypothetical protein